MILSKSFGMIQSGRVSVAPVFSDQEKYMDVFFPPQSFKCRYCWTQASTGTWRAVKKVPTRLRLDLKLSYFPS